MDERQILGEHLVVLVAHYRDEVKQASETLREWFGELPGKALFEVIQNPNDEEAKAWLETMLELSTTLTSAQKEHARYIRDKYT